MARAVCWLQACVGCRLSYGHAKGLIVALLACRGQGLAQAAAVVLVAHASCVWVDPSPATHSALTRMTPPVTVQQLSCAADAPGLRALWSADAW